MARISIKDNELVALLPKHLRESNELKSAAKLILGDLLFLYGRDFAKENGFVFRTNQDLMKDTGIKNGYTVTTALRKLEVEGFISRDSGKRGKASEYRLNMDKIKVDNNRHVVDNNRPETDITSQILEQLCVLSTKLDTMIEILNKIQVDNNRHVVDNNNSNRHVVDNNRPLTTPIDLQKQTQSTEGDKEAFYMDHTSISSIDENNYSSENKSKYMKHNDISSITSEEKNNILKYMKDNKISRPEVNVVANSENNGMNDNTTNNNSTPDHLPVTDTQHIDTTVSPIDGSHSHNECTVPSVDGKNNNIQPLQVPASDTSDTSTVSLSGDDGIGCDGGIGKVVNVGVNNESTAMNGDDTTHTTSEDNTNSTEANTGRLAHGNDTPQHKHYSSAKHSKKTTKDAAAAVGGGEKGGAGRNISTSAEQSPTSTEKVDNSQPLNMISAFDDSIERKLWGMLRKRKDVLIFRDFSDINGKQRIGVSDKAKRIINLTDATLDYDFDGKDTFGMLYNNGNGKFRFIPTDCNMTITTWDEGKKTDDNPVPNGVF